MSQNTYVPGLEGVVAAQTRMSKVDGLAGELVIGGFKLETIADKASYEEMVYQLWYGQLPTEIDLQTFTAELAALRSLPAAALDLLRSIAHKDLDMMDALRVATGVLGTETDAQDSDEWLAKRLLAATPTIVAAAWRLRNGQEPLSPDPKLAHAANYLYMLEGQAPSAARARGLETYLNTVIDHGLNASTFTARVIASTGSDFVSAIVGAIGALKGPLHGGAPGPALDMVFEIGEVSRAEEVLRKKLDAGERLMGFGHRVYKVRDPRADVLAKAAREFYEADGDMQLYHLVEEVEKIAIRVLEEHKPGRNLQTNVEFYTALLLHGLGFSVPCFTPTFAVGRVGGWLAHCFEQRENARIIRPQSEFIGDDNRAWVEVSQR
ncbi:MAG: citrate synthase/methylcitrate synthase [Anaerolineales bacterium]|nr:citrate synthase/methylcitrate synthase [Anaerolineales bacterium]MCW5855076.1 citrate synthase/methylcitrate synthase [Anaerolineales bacterium]